MAYCCLCQDSTKQRDLIITTGTLLPLMPKLRVGPMALVSVHYSWRYIELGLATYKLAYFKRKVTPEAPYRFHSLHFVYGCNRKTEKGMKNFAHGPVLLHGIKPGKALYRMPGSRFTGYWYYHQGVKFTAIGLYVAVAESWRMHRKLPLWFGIQSYLRVYYKASHLSLAAILQYNLTNYKK